MSKEAHTQDYEPIVLLDKQADILECNTKNILVTGGLGSGKTATGVHFVLKMATQYPDSVGLICAGTYSQLRDATMTAVTNELNRLGLIKDKDYRYVEGKHLFIYGTKVLLYSLENYEPLNGVEVGWSWIDEAAFIKKEAYEKVVERTRLDSGSCQILLTSTTNGFNWLYDRFVTKATDKHEVFKMLTQDNVFLPDDYYSNLVEQYGGEDTPIARQQLFGEFINHSEGQVYNYFNEDRHVKPVARFGSKLHIGVDFNKGNMNAVVCEVFEDSISIIDEIVLNKGFEGTHEMAQAIKEKYGTHNVEIIPDSTGNARKTSSQTTDHNILRDAGFTLNKRSKNPAIDDRQQELNHCFLRDKIEINPKCKHLISELHKLNHDDNEGKVAHISVALGYVVFLHNVAGLRRRKRVLRQINV